MIFTDLNIYCDWLMDQGIECDLLLARLHRGGIVPMVIPYIQKHNNNILFGDGHGYGLSHHYGNGDGDAGWLNSICKHDGSGYGSGSCVADGNFYYVEHA